MAPRKRPKKREDEPDEDRPRRKSRDRDGEDEPKKGISPLVWVAIGGGALVLLFGACLVGSLVLGSFKGKDRDKQPAGEKPMELTDAQIVELIDSPAKFKGKTLRLQLSMGRDGTLRDYKGLPVRFYAFGRKMVRLDIWITMPVDDDLPNAHWSDPLIVTFACNEGALDHGNTATKVERP